jgi:hypothetical protein
MQVSPIVYDKGSNRFRELHFRSGRGLEQSINKEIIPAKTDLQAVRGVDVEIGTLPGDEQQKIGPFMRRYWITWNRFLAERMKLLTSKPEGPMGKMGKIRNQRRYNSK